MTDPATSLLLRLGTRASALALAQTQRVIDRLVAVRPGLVCEPVAVGTEGDRDKTSPLTAIGGRGVFTSGLQAALAAGRIDAAVHSAKDLPAVSPPGLVLAAFPEREDPRDVVVSRHGVGLAELPLRPRIGTSSRRRAVQVRLGRPDAEIVDLRGNVDTRLAKAAAGDLDAIVLAAAGIVRLGLADRATEWLPLDRFPPAPGQGALAVEARQEDAATLALLAAVDDPLVSLPVRTERAFLAELGAGCTAPLGAHVAPLAGGWLLRAMLAAADGERVEWLEAAVDSAVPEESGRQAARDLLGRFARSLRPAVGLSGGPNGAGATASATPAIGAPGDGREADEPDLAGLRVVVTRPAAQAGPLAAALRARGAEPILLPTIRIEPLAGNAIAEARARLAAGGYDWVVFTSANAVAGLAASPDAPEAGDNGRLDQGGAAVAAVGRMTAAALGRIGIAAGLVPPVNTAAGLVAALAARGVAGARVLYPHGDLAGDTVGAGLTAAGAVVDAVAVYRTVPEPAPDPAVIDRVAAGEADVVTIASPSSLRALQALLGERAAVLAGTRIVCVGPVTAEAARRAGLAVAAVADEASVAGIVAAVARAAGGMPANGEPADGYGLAAVGGQPRGAERG